MKSEAGRRNGARALAVLLILALGAGCAHVEAGTEPVITGGQEVQQAPEVVQDATSPAPPAQEVVDVREHAEPAAPEEMEDTRTAAPEPAATPVSTPEPAATPVSTPEPAATPVSTPEPAAVPVSTPEPAPTPVSTPEPAAATRPSTGGASTQPDPVEPAGCEAPARSVDGYAVFQGDVDEARRAAVQDALWTAFQLEHADRFAPEHMANNYVLLSDRAAAILQETPASYDIQSEGVRAALYHVRLCVISPRGSVETPGGARVVIGGREVMTVDGREEDSALARAAVGEAMTGAGFRVSLADGVAASLPALADALPPGDGGLVLHIDATSRLYDRLGEFHLYEAEVSYQLALAGTGDLVAAGRVLSRNPRREITASEAARQALREAGLAAAGKVMEKLKQRLSQAVSYSVYVVGAQDRGELDNLIERMKTWSGVVGARWACESQGVSRIDLIVDRTVVPALPGLLEDGQAGGVEVLGNGLYAVFASLAR